MLAQERDSGRILTSLWAFVITSLGGMLLGKLLL